MFVRVRRHKNLNGAIYIGAQAFALPKTIKLSTYQRLDQKMNISKAGSVYELQDQMIKIYINQVEAELGKLFFVTPGVIKFYSNQLQVINQCCIWCLQHRFTVVSNMCLLYVLVCTWAARRKQGEKHTHTQTVTHRHGFTTHQYNACMYAYRHEDTNARGHAHVQAQMHNYKHMHTYTHTNPNVSLFAAQAITFCSREVWWLLHSSH